MKAEKRPALPRRLERGRLRFEEWRASRQSHRIPESLWNEAVGLAEEFGLHRTSRALRLNYEGLKSRVGRSREKRPGARRPVAGGAKGSGFVPLMSSGLFGSEGSAEYKRTDGSWMRVEWKGSAPELSTLSESFFHGER